MLPGSRAFHTQPDGLWLTLGIARDDTSTVAVYADCIVVEVCGSGQNLNDKRARYAARTTALMVDMRTPWLDGTVTLQGRGGTRRARRDVLGGQLRENAVLPVRHLRVLYVLDDGGAKSLMQQAQANMVFEAHEYVCPQRVLGQWTAPPMQEFLKRMRPLLLGSSLLSRGVLSPSGRGRTIGARCASAP